MSLQSERFVTQLQKDDPPLAKHLQTTGVLSRMGGVYKAWFGGLFAGVIPPGPLGRYKVEKTPWFSLSDN